MKQKGLLGISMLVVFSLAMWYLIRAGGNFETTAKIMIGILGSVLGWHGVSIVVEEAKKERHTCYICGIPTTRYCDFSMSGENECGRYACYRHIILSPNGRHDLCSDHENVSRLF